MSASGERDEVRIGTDPGLLDLDAIHAAPARQTWCEGIPKRTVRRALAHGLRWVRAPQARRTAAACAGLLGLLLCLSLAIAPPAAAQSVQQGLETLAGNMGPKLVASGPLSVVVPDFPTLRGEYCGLGRFAAERLTTQLSSTPALKVIERALLGRALLEMKLAMSDLADAEKAKQVGLRLGAEAIVLGALSDLATTIDLDARVFRVASGEVLYAGYTSFAKSQGVDALLRQDCGKPPLAAGPNDAGALAAAAALTPTGPALAGFDNGTFRVVIESARRAESSLTLVMTAENLTPKTIKLALRASAYLIDENGERWNQADADSAGYWAWGREFALNDLIPKVKRRTRVQFRPAGSGPASTQGQLFTLIGQEYRPQEGRVLTINGIRVPPQG
jgi:hypothetical protein